MSKEVIIYQTEDGLSKFSVILENETVWLTIDQMAELFNKSRSTINEHILNIYSENELKEDDTMRKIGIADFSTKPTNYYNLDVIISVGYRVKSLQGTRFRQWATLRLKDYIVKGFAMDDERLKSLGGGGYWKELLQRIRDIRSSEKIFYRQVLDIYATSIDYDPKTNVSIEFFKKVQNKIHFAIHGQTAAEVIFNRADAEKELWALGQIVSGYLDFAERQAEREKAMTMTDWASHLDRILTMSGEKLLQSAGHISHDKAIEKATNEYKKYQAKTLSEVEKNYLESLKAIEQKAKSIK
ncbi:MAG: virulence RhuM family protein [Saprospiraceae bacterium]|nr:virulence RhuM family protein [Saprospiraceae bacterium]